MRGNTTLTKQLAMWAREELHAQVEAALGNMEEASAETDGQIKAAKDVRRQREREEEIASVAYAWFHRLTAIRYMEVNGYLSGEKRALLPAELTKDVSDSGEPVQDNEQKKQRLLQLCHLLSEELPKLFPAIHAQTEELLPLEVFAPHGLLFRLWHDIPEEEWKSVSLIGWLHQYYNTRQKQQVFGALQKENVKISRERIPAVTQLFTPDWIVRYLVDRSLGEIQTDDWTRVRVMDPCMGSGHILVYAFDVLMEKYRQAGVDDAQAVHNILRYNLFGLDIDARAAQLSYFTILMKARQYDPDILQSGIEPQVLVVENSRFLTEPLMEFISGGSLEMKCDLLTLAEDLWEASDYGSLVELRPIDLEAIRARTEEIVHTYYDDIVSSLFARQVEEKLAPLLRQVEILRQSYQVVITNPPYMGKSAMDKKLRAYVKRSFPLSNHDLYAVFIEKCGRMLAPGGYQAMITQHSWMFLKRFELLRKRLLQTYTMVHLLHLGTRAFAEVSGEVVQTVSWVMKKTDAPEDAGTYLRLVEFGKDKEQAYLEELKTGRHHITYRKENAEFFKIPGAPLAYWLPSSAVSLFSLPSVADYGTVTNGMFTCDNRRFLRYWFEVPRERIAFDCTSKYECIAGGKKWFPYNKGGNFCRWYGNHEYIIDFEQFGEEIRKFRIASGQSSRFPGQDYYFQESLSWSLVSPTKFAIRYYPAGFVFDVAGSSLFPFQGEQMYALLGILAGWPVYQLLQVINPTINYQAGDIRSLPIVPEALNDPEIARLAKENVALAKENWDSKETSWGFVAHPVVRALQTRNADREKEAGACAEKYTQPEAEAVEAAYGRLEEGVRLALILEDERNKKLQENEERLNHILAKYYGMDYSPEAAAPERVPDVPYEEDESAGVLAGNAETESVDVASEEAVRTSRMARSFLSYIIGCLFGRFESACRPLTDNCLVLDEQGVLAQVERFLTEVFGKETLEENVCFLAQALDCAKQTDKLSDGQTYSQARLRILRYYQKEFYKEQLQRYQKRPIYWQLQSGKSGAFRALLYVHRYTPEDWSVWRKAAEERLAQCEQELQPQENEGNEAWRCQKQTKKRIEEEQQPQVRTDRQKASKSSRVRMRARYEELKEFLEHLKGCEQTPFVLETDRGILKNLDAFTRFLMQ